MPKHWAKSFCIFLVNLYKEGPIISHILGMRNLRQKSEVICLSYHS